jgi:tetratricopeptide (TPR) repeat protein
VLAIILLTTTSTIREALARIIWKEYKMAPVAGFLNQHDANLALELGNYHFNGGAYDLALAEKYFEDALANDPNSPIAWHQLARIAFLKGQFSKALFKINKQIELHADTVMASFYVRGLIYGYAGNLDGAIKDFQHFLEKKPDSWAAQNDLAWIYFRKGDFEKVEETAREGLKYHPENPWLLTSLGVALLNLDKKTEAKTTLEKAKIATENLTIANWGEAYPGNNPESYSAGLTKMRATIEFNLKLASS